MFLCDVCYVVLQDSAGSTADAVKAVESAGGTVVSQNASLGYVIARSSSSAFAASRFSRRT